MSRTEMPADLADEIRRRIFDDAGFMKVTQVARRGGGLFRVSLRPVTLRGEACFQGEMTDEGRTHVKNFDRDAARAGIEEMIAQTGPRELHLVTGNGDLHVRVTRKGRILVSRSAPLERPVAAAPTHDRVKAQPLLAFDAGPLLRVTGIAAADGAIRATLRGKYDQVNALLRVINTLAADLPEKRLTIVDGGCGRAYLTLAVHAFLTQAHGFDVRVCGIDCRADVVRAARDMARALDMDEQVTFIEGDLGSADPGFQPEMMLSLHACDTATDEALARGVEWKCRHILCAPCCQHELHKTLRPEGPMRALLRHGILRERLADLLTDAFRAQILRMLGFRVQTLEFVAPEATARNVLIKAEYALKPGQQQAVSDYLEMRDFFRVTPWLETRLASRLERHLAGH